MTSAELRAVCAEAWAHPNMRAFSMVVRRGEGTLGPNGYRTMFTGKLFSSMADHPRQVNKAMLGGRELASTAAGAYQFLARTWDACAKALGLEDFGEESQNLAFVYLVRGRKALDAVLAGRIIEAINLCRNEWASLPGSPYGQPTQKMADAVAFFAASGGQEGPGGDESSTAAPGYQEAAVAAPEAVLVGQERSSSAPQEPPATKPAEGGRMAPLIAGLATSLIEIFSPMVKDKITRELAKSTKASPQVAEQVSAAIVDTAKAVTGLEDPIAAVAAVKSDPGLVQRVEVVALEHFERMLPLVERLRSLDEGSVQKAREFNAANHHWFINLSWLRLSFVQALSVGLTSFSGWFAATKWDTLTEQTQGAIITLMVIAGYVGVRDYWMGSSDGSARKTEQLLKRGD